MAQESASIVQTCKICGADATGSFCSACGHELARPKLSWIKKLPLIGERVGFISTLAGVFRHPVKEPIRLSTTPAYRGHAGLLLSALAVWGTFVYFIGLGTGQPIQNASQTGGLSEPSQALFFIELALTGMLAWALFRALAPKPVRIDPHAKLWIVLAAFYLVAHVLIVAGASAAMLIAQESLPGEEAALQAWVPVLSVWIFWAVRTAMLLHYAVAFGRLWSMPAWQAALILIVAWALAIYPAWWLQYGLGYCYGVLAGGIQEMTTGGTAAGGQH